MLFRSAPLPAGARAPLDHAGWSALGLGLGPTCRPGGDRAERAIDHLFVNGPGRALVRRVSLRWDLGFATHAAFHVELEVGSAPLFPQRCRPVFLAGPAAPGWSESAACERLARESEPLWSAAFERQDLDGAWEVLSRAACAFLAERVGLEPGRAGREVAPRLRPAFATRVGREGEALKPKAAALLLRARHLRQVVASWPLGEIGRAHV